VHKDGNTFKLLGRPEGVDRLGGIDFDEIVFEHVMAGLPEAFEGLDENDPAVLSAIAAIRRECVEAKEALSSDTEVSIPVLTPKAQGSVRMHRSEFEAAIRPQVEDTVDALQRAVASAGLAPPQLSAVLLVGGSSRIPLVGQLVSELLGRPVSVDADPKNAISMGAVLSLQPAPTGTGPRPPRVPAPRSGGSARFPIAAAAGAPPLGGGGAPQGPYGPPAGQGGYGQGPLGAGASSSLPPHRPAPPRPPVAPPPRPTAAAYPPDLDDGPAFEPGYNYAPERRGKSPSWLVTAGAIGAAVAVVAAVFLWPRPDVEQADSTAPLPSTPTQQTTEPAPTTRPTPSEEPPATRPVPQPQPRPTTQPPATTTQPPATTTQPPATTAPTTEPPTSEPTIEPSEPPPNQGGGSATPEANTF
jgi:hypothetical protein